MLDIPVEKLGGRDLNEIQEEDLKAQATRRKVLESRFKTATLDPIEVESSPIQESEQTITSLTETVASLGIGETITVTTESSNPTKKTDENTQTSTDTEGPKEGSAGDEYEYGYSYSCHPHPRPLLSHLSPHPPPPPTPKDAVEYSNTQIDKVILVLWVYSKKL